MSVPPSLPDYAVHHPSGAAHGGTVFLLHGAFGAKEYWRHQIQALIAAGWRVVGWDAPGYGLSKLPVPLTIDHCARALGLLLHKEGGACNVVMGHSMGGMIAQQAWRHARARIHGYVLSATSAAFGSPDGDWQREFVRARVAPLDAGRSIPDYAPEMLRAMMAPGAGGPAVDLVVSTVSQMREETFRAAVAAVVGFEGRDLLPTLDVPVLGIAGELDQTAPAVVMQKMAAKIAGAEFVNLSGLGHFGWAEDPQRFNTAVLDFLARRLARPA
ncbi:MAG: alpha/beta hydrolase [Betaproteobacteria bacterium]|nr:alpha/beta hydrolase [Betaproteobacteria bacterium]